MAKEVILLLYPRGGDGSVIPVMMFSLSSCAENLGSVGGNIDEGDRNDQRSHA